MAQYKVPQDVEADDKLLGPFSFRQFVYLLIAGGLLALAVALFQLFPLLAILPIPFILFFAALALPLKKDQPTETYFAALISYYTKPRTRLWQPGHKETTIEITAPKVVEESRTRDITGEEATHRLSFLANIVDTGGYAIKDGAMGNNAMKDDLIAEANTATDMFETSHFEDLRSAIAQDEQVRHQEVMQEMKAAIARNENMNISNGTMPMIEKRSERGGVPRMETNYQTMVQPQPTVQPVEKVVEKSQENPQEIRQKPIAKASQNPPKPSIMELANNPDFSVATIAKEVNRINKKEDGEVFISLH